MNNQEFFERMLGHFVDALKIMKEVVQVNRKLCETFMAMADANKKMCDALQMLLDHE